jgi:hypothetical protein
LPDRPRQLTVRAAGRTSRPFEEDPVSTDQHTPTPAGTSGQTSGIGIAGFVTGLLGALLSWFPLAGIILGILGVVLGGVGVSQGRRTGAKTGLAIAGAVLGVIALVISIALVVWVASEA